MSSELESRLRRLLSGPTSSSEVEERALRASLAALPTPDRGANRFRAIALSAAATIGVMTVAAGALAAAGALHVSLGRTPAAPAAGSAVSRLVLQKGMRGIAAVIDGRLWLTTRGGTRIEGLPVTSAELSPYARYVGAGIGHTLVTMAPDGRRAWAHATRGDVAAISWAPDGLLIAYVVHAGGDFQLRMIEGDGDHDRLIDPGVRPSRPSWRADGLALAYVGAGGHAVVYDLAHRSRSVPHLAAHASAVSYAPAGDALAIASSHRLWITASGKRPHLVVKRAGALSGIAWTRRSIAVGVNAGGGTAFVQFISRNGAHQIVQRVVTGAPILALAANGDRVAVAVGGALPRLRLLTSTPRGSGTPSSDHVLLVLPDGAKVSYFVTR